ncbi:alpha/beta hydrolase [Tunturiibacter gelidiferens]
MKLILALQHGPSILVAHSYGGAVITEAGNDQSVVGLVYRGPHAGFRRERVGRRKALSERPRQIGRHKEMPDGFTYIDPAQFRELFAADLPGDKAAFMARAQVLNFAYNFSATITTAAWRTKPISLRLASQGSGRCN